MSIWTITPGSGVRFGLLRPVVRSLTTRRGNLLRSPLHSMPKLPGMNLASKPRTFEVTPSRRVVRLCTTGGGMLNLTPEPVSECVSEKTISETPSRRNTRIWRFGKKWQNNICLTKSRRKITTIFFIDCPITLRHCGAISNTMTS